MSPEDTNALVTAVVANAKRLGLIWTIRPATITNVEPGVVSGSGMFDSNTTEVEVPLIPLTDVIVGDRVFVMSIPEGGNYILGSSNTANRQVRYLDANVSTTNPAASSGAVGTEAAVASGNWLNEPLFDLEPGQMYAVHCQGMHSPSALGQTAQVRIREGSATITGTLLWFNTVAAASIFAAESWDFTAYVMNATGAVVQTQLSMSVVRSAGAAGAHTIGGAANIPLLMNVSHIGTVAENIGLALVAGSVT